MTQEMLINVLEGEECRIAIVKDGALKEIYVERTGTDRRVGNIFKGRVTNIEPSIQAAFVDIGLPKNAFLHVSDLVPGAYPNRKRPSADVEKKGRGLSRAESRGPRRLPIQEILRQGDELLVQITKEGIGTKGPSVTTALSIAGRYLVLMPSLPRLGVSRKIEDDKVRRQLRDLLASTSPPKNLGFIVRTAGQDRGKRDLSRDVNYLTRLWKVVRSDAQSAKAPAEIFRESDLVVRTLRDILTLDTETIWVDSEPVLKRVVEFLKIALPRHANRAKLYDGTIPLFHKYHLEEALEQIHSRTVPLPRGGTLVIDQTEALVAIDVNSGKFRHGKDAEESAHQLNVLAAKEIARQIRLRDLGGVLVIDFVDMDKEENRRHVEKTLRDALKGDRARQRMLRISKFGIVEMTRQRVKASLQRATYMDCPYCKGAGVIKTPESMALEVMRNVRLLVHQQNVATLEVRLHPEVGDYLNNVKRDGLLELQSNLGKRIILMSDPSAHINQAAYRCLDDRGMEVRPEIAPSRTQAGGAPASR
jgi:ribonuclease E